jgi:hypothetical protein
MTTRNAQPATRNAQRETGNTIPDACDLVKLKSRVEDSERVG